MTHPLVLRHPPELRVVAISRASERILRAAGAWQLLDSGRLCPYERMRVWHETSPPTGTNALSFDAADIGEPNLGFIAENIREHIADRNRETEYMESLVKDLKQRGMLEETLVVWAGEFGRTPFSQGSNGRDHNPFGFSIWMAGGGVKPGFTYGATDDLGYQAVENPCTVYDLWATVLHLLGIDHEKLTYRYSGRDVRLTDVHGKVMKEIVA